MRKTKCLAFVSIMTVVFAIVPFVFFSLYGFHVGMAFLMQDSLYFMNRNVKLGDKYGRCRWVWKRDKNLLFTVNESPTANIGGKFVIDLRLKSHPLLSSRSHLTLIFEHATLVKKEFHEVWKPF